MISLFSYTLTTLQTYSDIKHELSLQSEAYNYTKALEQFNGLSQLNFQLKDELHEVVGKGPSMISQIQTYRDSYVNFMSHLGYGLSQIDQFPYQEQMQIIAQLQMKQTLIDQIYVNMTYISSIMHAYKNDTCNQRFLISRDQIFKAFNLLAFNVVQDQLNYNETSYQEFMQYCMDDICSEALSRLLFSIIGETPSDCLILDVIKYGSVQNGFQAGNSDVFAYQGAYMLQLISMASIVETAFRGYSDKDLSLQVLSRLYDNRLTQAFDVVLATYSQITQNFFENGRINLIQQTQNLLNSNLNEDDLVNGAEEYIRAFVNYYNPQINWEAFMFKGSYLQINCLNCFIYDDPNSDQNIVYFYYNVSNQPVSLLNIQKNLSDWTKNYTNTSSYTKYLLVNKTLCLSGVIYLPVNPRIIDQTSYNFYTQIPGTIFSAIMWQQPDVGCLTLETFDPQVNKQRLKSGINPLYIDEVDSYEEIIYTNY
eukprot:403367922